MATAELADMTNTARLLTTLLATSLFGACATDDPIDPQDPMNPMDPATDPACTAATDVVPFDEIAGSLAHFSGYAGDLARASDGTIYFVSSIAGDLQSATIGRREACKTIEKEWLTVSAPVIDLEVGADNKLYLGASGAGSVTNLEARLYRFDLANPSALPDVLVREPGEVLYSLSAGSNGRVYFIQGSSQRSLRYVDGDDIKTVVALPYNASYPMSVAALPDGDAMVSGTVVTPAAVTRQLARVDVAADGSGTLQQPLVLPKGLTTLQADASGGFYGIYETGVRPQPVTYTLVHGASLGTSPSMVAESADVPESLRVAFGIDGNAHTAVLFTPAAPTRTTVVALPTPMMTL